MRKLLVLLALYALTTPASAEYFQGSYDFDFNTSIMQLCYEDEADCSHYHTSDGAPTIFLHAGVSDPDTDRYLSASNILFSTAPVPDSCNLPEDLSILPYTVTDVTVPAGFTVAWFTQLRDNDLPASNNLVNVYGTVSMQKDYRAPLDYDGTVQWSMDIGGSSRRCDEPQPSNEVWIKLWVEDAFTSEISLLNDAEVKLKEGNEVRTMANFGDGWYFAYGVPQQPFLIIAKTGVTDPSRARAEMLVNDRLPNPTAEMWRVDFTSAVQTHEEAINQPLLSNYHCNDTGTTFLCGNVYNQFFLVAYLW